MVLGHGSTQRLECATRGGGHKGDLRAEQGEAVEAMQWQIDSSEVPYFLGHFAMHHSSGPGLVSGDRDLLGRLDGVFFQFLFFYSRDGYGGGEEAETGQQGGTLAMILLYQWAIMGGAWAPRRASTEPPRR